MEIMYVDIRADTDTDKKALKAVREPMLMRDMTTVKPMVNIIEFVGTRWRVSTWASHSEKIRPLSRAKACLI